MVVLSGFLMCCKQKWNVFPLNPDFEFLSTPSGRQKTSQTQLKEMILFFLQRNVGLGLQRMPVTLRLCLCRYNLCLHVFGLKVYPSCHWDVLLCYKHVIILELNTKFSLYFNQTDMQIFPHGYSMNYSQHSSFYIHSSRLHGNMNRSSAEICFRALFWKEKSTKLQCFSFFSHWPGSSYLSSLDHGVRDKKIAWSKIYCSYFIENDIWMLKLWSSSSGNTDLWKLFGFNVLKECCMFKWLDSSLRKITKK